MEAPARARLAHRPPAPRERVAGPNGRPVDNRFEPDLAKRRDDLHRVRQAVLDALERGREEVKGKVARRATARTREPDRWTHVREHSAAL